MSVLRLHDNPQLFDDTVDLYNKYLLDSWVPGFNCELTAEEVKNQVQISLDGGRDYFLEITTDNTCVGVTFGEPHEEIQRLYQTWGLYVLPEYRRNGVGSKLKKSQIDFVKRTGDFDWIFSQIHASNVWSKKLHDKLGFFVKLDEETNWYMAWLNL